MHFVPHSIYTSELAKRGELITHDKDKNVIMMMDFNRLIETNSSYSELSDFKETHHNKTINKYNDNGNLTEKIYFENGNLTQSFQYNYIDNNMVEQFQYNSNKEILFHTIKKYNSQNQIIKHLTNLGKEDSSIGLLPVPTYLSSR